MTDLHARVAARAQAADLPITAAGVAEIDRMLGEERARRTGELLSGHHGAAGLVTACAVVREGAR
jgi:hypothetical protein